MKKLMEGINRYRTTVVEPQREMFEGLAEGQRPEALFITCSDSRINPNLITQTNPGELFILRNAGNIIPPYGAVYGGEAATLEFAVSVLNVRDIIVCGHTHCGAMDALADGDKVRDMPAMHAWLKHAEATRRIMRENYPAMPPDQFKVIAAQENVLVQIENLQTHPAIAARLAAKKVNLHAWMYVLETGDVFAYDDKVGKFVPAAQHPVSPTQRPVRLGEI
jgi:carbonic anhydrase